MDLWKECNPPDILPDISRTLAELGDICVITKEFSDAETHYTLGLNTLALQNAPPADPEHYLSCYRGLYLLYKITRNINKAEIYAPKYHELKALLDDEKRTETQ